jgi:hypothetical protein
MYGLFTLAGDIMKTITRVCYKFSEPQLRDYGCFHTVVFQQDKAITLFCLFLGGGGNISLKPFLTDGREECQGYGITQFQALRFFAWNLIKFWVYK